MALANRTYFIQTYGCQMNENDSEILAGFLEEEGYKKAGSLAEADVVLINTCCVREKAEQKVYTQIGRLKKLKEKNPELILGVCGCMMQQEDVAEYVNRRFPYVDLVFGTHRLPDFLSYLRRARDERERVLDISGKAREICEDLPYVRADGVKAFVTITQGCTNFCTYCIVPYVRGPERSRRVGDIVSEVRALAKDGYKEVTLLGQNVNVYGKDLGGEATFRNLLRRLNGVEGLERIRFMTSHPRDFTREMVEAVAELDKVCEHFHLPLQAGSNAVLKAMNRGYAREHYFKLIDLIRERIPEAAITTDLIVGFPGETEEDFRATLDAVQRVQYDSAFMFKYSPRRGTKAAKMEKQLPEEVKKRRLQELIELQNEISDRKSRSLIGSYQEVLVEGKSEKEPDKMSGRTRTNRAVIVEGDDLKPGDIVTVEVTNGHAWSLRGRKVQKGEMPLC